MTIRIATVLKNHRINREEENSFKEATADEKLIDRCSQNPSNKKHLVTLYQQAPRELIALLKYALDNADSLYRYVNKATSWKNWDNTLSDWRKNVLRDDRVQKVLAILPEAKEHVGAVYAATKRFGEAVVARAVTAKETAKDGKLKYFCWLTSEERRKEYVIY